MHRFANPARFLRLAKPLTPCPVLAGTCCWRSVPACGGCWAYADRTVDGRHRQDHLRPCSVRVARHGWLDGYCDCQSGAACVAPSAWPELQRVRLPFPVRPVRGNLSFNGFDLGSPDLGHMVGVGRAVDVDAGPVLSSISVILHLPMPAVKRVIPAAWLRSLASSAL